MPMSRAAVIDRAPMEALVDHDEHSPVGRELGEHRPQRTLVVGQHLVVDASPGAVEGAGVVVLFADVDPAEHLVELLSIRHLNLSVACVSTVATPTQTPAPQPRCVRPSPPAGTYERSPASAAAGDNTPQIMEAQGKSVMPAAVACHPIAEDAKKVIGGWGWSRPGLSLHMQNHPRS